MNCLSNEQLQTLLCAAPDLELLEHIAACEACAAQLAEQTLALPMLEPPAGLQNEVLRKTRAAPARQAESLGSYTLRVFAAMAAVLVLLFSGAFEKLAKLPEDLPKLAEQISDQLSSLNSQFPTLIQKEEFPGESKPQ